VTLGRNSAGYKWQTVTLEDLLFDIFLLSISYDGCWIIAAFTPTQVTVSCHSSHATSFLYTHTKMERKRDFSISARTYLPDGVRDFFSEIEHIISWYGEGY